MRAATTSALFGLARLPIFVDTTAWYAVRVREDRASTAARDTLRRLTIDEFLLATTNLVVGETYTLLRARRGYQAAWAFLDVLERTTRLTRHFLTPELETQAYAILRQYRDHDFSYVDATSFAFMRSRGISDAFAFDAHFATAGFTRIPLDRPLD